MEIDFGLIRQRGSSSFPTVKLGLSWVERGGWHSSSRCWGKVLTAKILNDFRFVDFCYYRERILSASSSFFDIFQLKLFRSMHKNWGTFERSNDLTNLFFLVFSLILLISEIFLRIIFHLFFGTRAQIAQSQFILQTKKKKRKGKVARGIFTFRMRKVEGFHQLSHSSRPRSKNDGISNKFQNFLSFFSVRAACFSW